MKRRVEQAVLLLVVANDIGPRPAGVQFQRYAPPEDRARRQTTRTPERGVKQRLTEFHGLKPCRDARGSHLERSVRRLFFQSPQQLLVRGLLRAQNRNGFLTTKTAPPPRLRVTHDFFEDVKTVLGAEERRKLGA